MTQRLSKMPRLTTQLAVTALTLTTLMASPTAASAESEPYNVAFPLEVDDAVVIYKQSNKNHPAPVFLICAGNGNYEVDLFGHNGEALETIPASSCIYVSSSEISATLPAKSLEEIARTGNAIGRTTSWLDTRIQELESKSEPTEADVNLLKSFKERRYQTREISDRTQGPPHVLVTLMR